MVCWKKETEFVQEINFELPVSPSLFNFEKVSKRTFLDIASVNTAISLQLNPNGAISHAAISAGGVAPVPKFLFKTFRKLLQKRIFKNCFLKSAKFKKSK